MRAVYEPLLALADKAVAQEMLDAIAAEYAKGRLLLNATVDLDARQSVLWNLTKFAGSKNPKAARLFHSLMVASAAIPAAFPPSMIDVEADGKAYQEMHVDGGTMGPGVRLPSVPPRRGGCREIARQP